MRLAVWGTGAVSPAGWGVDALVQATAGSPELPTQAVSLPGRTLPLAVRMVPKPSGSLPFLNHARLRRSSPISRFAMSAAMEALGSDTPRVQSGELRLGLVVCVMAGCVNYSRRFYEETFRDPATASPLVFPETVFNAPASHLATVLGSTGLTYSLVGDAGTFLTGLALGAGWLCAGQVDAALVVAAEESDWLVADACRRFQKNVVLSEGAGAVYLKRAEPGKDQPTLTGITDAHSYLAERRPERAVAEMRRELPAGARDDLLVDSSPSGFRRVEERVWADWPGARLSPKKVLGEGLAAGSAWQCVAALEALRRDRYGRAVVSVVGTSQQAVGAIFERAPEASLSSGTRF